MQTLSTPLMAPRPETTSVQTSEVFETPSKRTLEVYSKIAQIRTGTMVVRYDGNDLRRMFMNNPEWDDDNGQPPVLIRELGPSDSLSNMLLRSLRRLPTDGEGRRGIHITESLATLVAGDVKQYSPRCFVAYDVKSEARIVGAMTVVNFVADSSFSTNRLTRSYCSQHGLPAFDANWMLVDVVSSSKKGSASMMILSAWLSCMRLRRRGIVAIGGSTAGKRLFRTLGFKSYRDVFYMKVGDLDMSNLHKKLKVDDAIVSDLCWRHGLTTKTADKVVSRC